MKILKGERHEPREEAQLLGSRTVRYLHHKVGCYSIYSIYSIYIHHKVGCYSIYKCQSVVFSNIFIIYHCCILYRKLGNVEVLSLRWEFQNKSLHFFDPKQLYCVHYFAIIHYYYPPNVIDTGWRTSNSTWHIFATQDTLIPHTFPKDVIIVACFPTIWPRKNFRLIYCHGSGKVFAKQIPEIASKALCQPETNFFFCKLLQTSSWHRWPSILQLINWTYFQDPRKLLSVPNPWILHPSPDF